MARAALCLLINIALYEIGDQRNILVEEVAMGPRPYLIIKTAQVVLPEKIIPDRA